MLKTTKLLERSTSKKLNVGDNKVVRFGIDNGDSFLNQKIV